MELNKVIKMKNGLLFDVSEMLRTQRIIYFKKSNEIIIKCDAGRASLINQEKYDGKAIILTPSKAVRIFPKVFFNSSIKESNKSDKRTIILNVTSEMYGFCCRQGCISTFIRALIEREMRKEND